jgi:GAF domain-containing protein
MRVLCVDPAPAERRATTAALRDAGIDAAGCASIGDARDLLDEATAGIVTEYDLPDGTGFDLVEHARETVPDAPCVLFTGADFETIDTERIGRTVVEYVDKGAPGARDELADLLAFSIDNRTQTAYPLPPDEDARLDSLDAYVDDPDALDPAFDRLTTVATALFDVEAATVGFVDDHQERFVACHGTDVDRLEREKTICTHTILEDDVLVIPDTTTDPRFADNEALPAADIRFYAGAPIRVDDGAAIGVFCLFDPEPRSFPASDRELLSTLADEVTAQLVLRRRLREATDGGPNE